MGDFFLYFNNSLVLKTDYDKSRDYDNYDEFAPPVKPKIAGVFESIKLDDWVEDLPKIVQVEKLKQQERQELKREEQKKLQGLNSNHVLSQYSKQIRQQGNSWDT